MTELVKRSYPPVMTIEEIALETCRLIKDNAHAKITDTMWLPLTTLYQKMASNNEITSIRKIGQDKKLLYWTEVCVARPEASKFKKICIMQALYMYDLIAEKI